MLTGKETRVALFDGEEDEGAGAEGAGGSNDAGREGGDDDDDDDEEDDGSGATPAAAIALACESEPTPRRRASFLLDPDSARAIPEAALATAPACDATSSTTEVPKPNTAPT